MSPDGVERRLAAILSADVVGYSRLMSDDEAATVRTLASYREEVARLVRQHRGRLVDCTGDNFLAEFASALSAAECAIEIQSVLQVRNGQLPRERKMELRVGVHLGDVRVERDAIFGEGIIVAARLQGLAESGGICISGAMREQLRSKLAVTYQDLGEQALKNLPELVRAYRIGGGAPATAREVSTRGRIAVLPLENLSGDPEQEYFADGMTESLIGDLGKIRSLRVISRTSVMQYKHARKALPQIARELGVDFIVEGTVTREAERIRITAQLVDGRTDEHLWAERYERPLRSVLDLQGELATAIAQQVRVELRPSEQARLENRRPVDPAAHNALLKGIYHIGRWVPESHRLAVSLFEHAIEIDPDYALAHAWLGIAWWAPAAAIGPHLEVVPKAKVAALRALELDETLGEAHALLGNVALWFDWDWPSAERHLRRALELSPSFPLAHNGYAFYLSSCGRHQEAIAEGRRMMEPAPLDLGWLTAIAYLHDFAGRYDDALAQVREVLDLDPSLRGTHALLGRIYLNLGRYGESIDAYESAEMLTSEEASALRGALSRAGTGGALPEWVRIFRSRPFELYAAHLVAALDQLGERDEVFAELERAYAARDPMLPFLRVHPAFDRIRGDPRFDDLVRRVGIPEG